MIYEITDKTLKDIFFILLLAAMTSVSLFLFSIENKTEIVAQTCPTGCQWNSGISGCVGPDGCVWRNCSGGTGCYSGESCYTGFCCDDGPCIGCDPAPCDTYYSEDPNSCATDVNTCTKERCTGVSCGTSTRTCYLDDYTLTYTAGSGGYISGTTPQSVCRGSSGTQVTAMPNAGYQFVQWSDSVMTASRTDTNVTSSKSVTASFTLSNQAPTAPLNLKTENSTNPTGVTDTTPEFKATFDDPNTSDTAIYYEIEVNTNNTFTGTVMWDTGKTALSPAVAEGNEMPDKSYAGTALSLNGTTYYWRIRFWDNSDAQGAWSSVAQFTMNTAPSAPTSLQTEQATNPTRVSDQKPDFRAIFQDPNAGDTGIYYEIQVNSINDFSGAVLWGSGQQSMSSTAIGSYSPELEYGGSNLPLDGSTYYWRIRFTDNHLTVGSWSSVAQFTMNRPPTSPTSLETEGATNPTGVSDTTPEFTALFQDPDTGDTGTKYEINVNTASDFTGTVMWSSGQQDMSSTAIGVRSPLISYAGTPLSQDGSTYYWRIRFTDNNGTVGSWSSTAQFTMNNPPNSPSNLYTEGSTNPTAVGDLTPEFSAIFSDTDSGDTGSYYELEVNSNSSFTGTVMWDSGKTSISTISNGSRSSDITYSGSALSHNNTTYYWRIRFWDQKDAVSDWSSTANFTMQEQPNAPTSLQTDSVVSNPNVSDLTPEFSAVFTDNDAGDTGTYYEIEVNTLESFTGTVMWDSGKTLHSPAITNGSRSSEISYAGTALTANGTKYYWRIRFWDQNDAVSNWSNIAYFIMQYPPSAPTELLTDGSTNPAGIDSLTPDFSAIYNDVNMHSATAYEIEVNTNDSFIGTVMWDTDKMSTSVAAGNRSPNYTYAGSSLAEDTTYYWRIRFWDSDDLMGDWSSPANFTSSLNRQLFNGLRMSGLQLH